MNRGDRIHPVNKSPTKQANSEENHKSSKRRMNHLTVPEPTRGVNKRVSTPLSAIAESDKVRNRTKSQDKSKSRKSFTGPHQRAGWNNSRHRAQWRVVGALAIITTTATAVLVVLAFTLEEWEVWNVVILSVCIITVILVSFVVFSDSCFLRLRILQIYSSVVIIKVPWQICDWCHLLSRLFYFAKTSYQLHVFFRFLLIYEWSGQSQSKNFPSINPQYRNNCAINVIGHHSTVILLRFLQIITYNGDRIQLLSEVSGINITTYPSYFLLEHYDPTMGNNITQLAVSKKVINGILGLCDTVNSKYTN